jgi:hypothetical protein
MAHPTFGPGKGVGTGGVLAFCNNHPISYMIRD